MNAIERAVVGLCRAVLWLSTAVIFVILCANTVLRYATGSSVQWANEVPELLFPWLVMAGVVLAAVHGAHITTTFMIDVLPAKVRRVVASASWLVAAPTSRSRATSACSTSCTTRSHRSCSCRARSPTPA